MAGTTSTTSNGKMRGKMGWQRVVRSQSVMGTGRSASMTRPRLTMQQQLQLQQQRWKEEEERRKELDTKLQSTKTDMEDITAKYENEKCKTEEMAGQLELLKAELASTCAQLERASRSLEVVREESRQKAQLVAGLQKEVRRLEDRMNVLEYRCMDVEKLEIAVENGRKAFEAKQQQLSLSEHEVRALTRSVEEQQQVITETEARITTMTAQVDDLKIQVREEVIKNVSLEEKVAAIPSLEERLNEKEVEAAELRKTLEEKDILYHHTRQSLREEKGKNQKLSEEMATAMNMKEEYNMALAENITLKKLVQAKDVLLIQKSQVLANVRNIVSSGCHGNEVDELLQEALDSKGAFVATYPLGSRMQEVDWQREEDNLGSQTNGKEAVCLPGCYEECSDVKVKFRPTAPRRDLRLLVDVPEVSSSVQGTQNGTPEKLSGAPEVSSCASEMTRNSPKAAPGATELLSDSLEIHSRSPEGTRVKPTTSFFKSLLRQDNGRLQVNGSRSGNVSPTPTVKTCIVRPQLYSGSSFADFRNIRSTATSGGDDFTTVNLKLDSSGAASVPSGGSAIVKKVLGFRVRGPSRRTNKITVFAASSPREATTATQRACSAGAAGAPRCFLRTSSFLSPESLAPKRDKAVASVVRVGSRVIVDLNKRRDKHRNRQSGVVQYTGTLDKQHDAFCLYAGIRFDKPIGDTDGMYRGKHYFNTCSKHGRFVRITKVISVLDERNVYRDVEDLLGAGQSGHTHAD